MNDVNKNTKEDTKKFVIISILVVALAIVSVVGLVSYAYFVVIPKVNDPNGNRNVSVTTNTFDYDFTTDQRINNSKLLLIKPANVASDSEKAIFRITKKSNIDYAIKYNIVLTDFTISDNFKNADFKWDLLENGKSIYHGTFLNAVSGSDYLLTSSPIVLNDNSADYELRIWLEETNVNQENLYNGNFSCKVEIVASSIPR